MHGMRAPNRLLAGLRETEKADLALAYELCHRSDRLLDGYRRIYAMLVEQVDAIGREPAQ